MSAGDDATAADRWWHAQTPRWRKKKYEWLSGKNDPDTPRPSRRSSHRSTESHEQLPGQMTIDDTKGKP